MKAAVIVFPASNCDRDAFTTLQSVAHTGSNQSGFSEHDIVKVWHADSELPKCDVVVIPGGFSYGDYLRSGAMAAHSPIMQEVIKHASQGGYVLGICNGFQVLTESGLLPGVLMRNEKLKFVCRETFLRVENNETAFTRSYQKGQVLNIPVAHHDGNYYADANTLAELNAHNQVAFRYVTAEGKVEPEANPNGSQQNIAGVFNRQKNVLGMMPHPERHADALIGNCDGRPLFESLLAA
jgi:phosphoribosylformylglycinamidine synthase subunit PurQ / glutaminase